MLTMTEEKLTRRWIHTIKDGQRVDVGPRRLLPDGGEELIKPVITIRRRGSGFVLEMRPDWKAEVKVES